MEISKYKDRHEGIELLRIVSMFMIVVSHILGRVQTCIPDYGVEYWMLWGIRPIVSCAVNCYALISGYVGWNKKNSFGKIIGLWCQVAFYTIGLTLLLSIIRPDLMYLDAYIYALFPITSGQYWYITAYFGLMFVMPFLNSGIQKMKKSQLLVSIVLLLGSFVILPMFLPDFSIGEGYGLAGGFSTLWLATLYILGAVINKYHILNGLKKKCACILFMAAASFSVCFMLLFSSNNSLFFFSWFSAKRFMVSTAITILLEAVALLSVFENIKLGGLKREIVLYTAPSTLGVYLLHEFPLLKYNILLMCWDRFADKTLYEMIGLIFVSASIIFILGVGIDLVRRFLFQKINVRTKCNDLAEMIEKKLDSLLSIEEEE